MSDDRARAQFEAAEAVERYTAARAWLATHPAPTDFGLRVDWQGASDPAVHAAMVEIVTGQLLPVFYPLLVGAVDQLRLAAATACRQAGVSFEVNSYPIAAKTP